MSNNWSVKHVWTHFPPSSVLGCPIVKKRKLEEAEAEENQPASKQRNLPTKRPEEESDTAEEEERIGNEEVGEDVIKDTIKAKTEVTQGEWSQTRKNNYNISVI